VCLTLRGYTWLEDAQKRGLNKKKRATLLPPPPSFGSKRYTFAPKAGQMSLKWESFADESLIFFRTDTTTKYWTFIL
jgi:hypothetical protein